MRLRRQASATFRSVTCAKSAICIQMTAMQLTTVQTHTHKTLKVRCLNKTYWSYSHCLAARFFLSAAALCRHCASPSRSLKDDWASLGKEGRGHASIIHAILDGTKCLLTWRGCDQWCRMGQSEGLVLFASALNHNRFLPKEVLASLSIQ